MDNSDPITEMNPATFQEQLRSLNRAYAITYLKGDKESQFIEMMLKKAYPDAEKIEIEELE